MGHEVVVTGFAPLADDAARVLVLGSLPSVASVQAGQYYGHARNAFWPIMGRLFAFDANADYPERCAALMAAGVAVWDVAAQAQRPGSLDSAIRPPSVRPTDLDGLLQRCPGIGHLFFNGGTAARLFRRHHPADAAIRQLPATQLPSTSPAHASLRFEQKLAAWQSLRERLQAS
ncbi:MAG: DNA-deoxyinosine glycosylase [Abyssibacter sp.]|uniref:DNA-deoxyinosine glycosylase n=1 Tax=Abyssibacter sp. TaxID=2320200 RepID=UPI00321A885F